jgi:hypothetical protein
MGPMVDSKRGAIVLANVNYRTWREITVNTIVSVTTFFLLSLLFLIRILNCLECSASITIAHIRKRARKVSVVCALAAGTEDGMFLCLLIRPPGGVVWGMPCGRPSHEKRPARHVMVGVALAAVLTATSASGFSQGISQAATPG